MSTPPFPSLRQSLLVLTLCLPAADLVLAQSGTHPSTGTSARPQDGIGKKREGLQAMERRFIEQAAMSGMAEVELGKLAQQKAANAAVKQYGQAMASEHTNANLQLKQLATSKGVVVPDQPSPKQQNDMKMLQTLSGPEFDRQYMAHMVSDHEKTIADFDRLSRDGQDLELKAYAASTLPTLRKHLQHAQQVRDAVSAERQSSAK
ncbi:MAG: DUF4142 domain-containing protein [Pseudomonadota bacterium]